MLNTGLLANTLVNTFTSMLHEAASHQTFVLGPRGHLKLT